MPRHVKALGDWGQQSSVPHPVTKRPPTQFYGLHRMATGSVLGAFETNVVAAPHMRAQWRGDGWGRAKIQAHHASMVVAVWFM